MSDESTLVVTVIIGVIGIVCVGLAIGSSSARLDHRQKAIEAGVAEYTIDPKTGETSFVYKTCK